MDVVDGEDVIFVEDDFIALMQSMQASLVQRIVHGALEELPVTLHDLNPEVFSPAS